MSDAPERIWTTSGGDAGSWTTTQSRMAVHMPDGWQVEYVRADLVPQWQPIEEMPEEWKDMRDIILLAGGQMEVGFFGVGSKDWCNADGELESQPTHYLTGIPTPPASKEGE